MHQAASRMLRKDIATIFKKSLKELDSVDLDEFLQGIEQHAVEVEKNFIKIFSSEEQNKDYESIRAKFFSNGSTAPIPTFDFELN